VGHLGHPKDQQGVGITDLMTSKINAFLVNGFLSYSMKRACGIACIEINI
jgi:hypothetical protein